MRGAIDGLRSPFPLIERLPAVFQEDDLVARISEAIDELLAPAICVLDNFACYLDPALTPADMLGWLGDCVGADLDSAWSSAEQRAVVADAVAVHRRRGTSATLVEALRRVADVQVTVAEGGGSAVSLVPGGALPGTAEQGVTISVAVAQGPDRDAILERVRVAARRLVPAHLIIRVVAGRADPPPPVSYTKPGRTT